MQDLAYLLRTQASTLEGLDLLQFYIDQKFSVGSAVHKMLCQSLACKRMVLAIDGNSSLGL